LNYQTYDSASSIAVPMQLHIDHFGSMRTGLTPLAEENIKSSHSRNKSLVDLERLDMQNISKVYGMGTNRHGLEQDRKQDKPRQAAQ